MRSDARRDPVGADHNPAVLGEPLALAEHRAAAAARAK
jgi:hypothetical protein